MRELEKFCNSVEKMSRAELDQLMADDATMAMRGLMVVAGGDFKKAMGMLTGAAMAAASVDGKLDEAEYRQINGLIAAAVGKENSASYAEVKALVEKTVDLSTNDRDYVRSIHFAIARVDKDAAFAFITFLAEMLCADGDASWKERKWLKSLYE